MLQFLPWNAYNNDFNSSSDTNTIKSNIMSPTKKVALASMKRKRSSDDRDEDRVGGRQVEQSAMANALHQRLADLGPGPSIASTAVTNSIPKPSEGLLTPMLSPTESSMPATSDDEKSTVSSCAANNRVHQIRQVISNQINLEILLKHGELRLIDQELAKCQTALEQLRRCTEIPFPTNTLSIDASKGQGPTLKTRYRGAKLPSSPAPWGVVDGPYTRHYAQWLLPDSRFDGGEPDAILSVAGKRPTKGRHVRTPTYEDSAVGVQSRSQRGAQLASLPAGYAQPKEKATGPLLLKRKSDGSMVKLVCPDCGRHDFGSAQGFINHCRIGHSRNFASHDAAAEVCGQPVELDDDGLVKGEKVAAPASSSNKVHPLVRAAHLMPPSTVPVPRVMISQYDGVADHEPYGIKQESSISPDFRGSTQTPFLSALIKGKGLGLNLQDIVKDAKIKIVDAAESEEEVLEEDLGQTTNVGGHRHPVSGGRQVADKSSSAGNSPLLQSRIPASVGQGTMNETEIRTSGMGFNTPEESSFQTGPSPVSESAQAPSLIDDDEEFDAHSPASSSAMDHADEEIEFQVQDDDDSQHLELQRSEYQPSCAQPNPQAPEMTPMGPPSALRSQAETRGEKHVSFHSPQRDMGESDRKRRKIVKS